MSILSILAEIDPVKLYPDLWIHIDSAWAGSAFSLPELREKLYVKEINEVASSICTNFHKVMLSLPYMCLNQTHREVVGPREF